jgi:hypothetical protein
MDPFLIRLFQPDIIKLIIMNSSANLHYLYSEYLFCHACKNKMPDYDITCGCLSVCYCSNNCSIAVSDKFKEHDCLYVKIFNILQPPDRDLNYARKITDTISLVYRYNGNYDMIENFKNGQFSCRFCHDVHPDSLCDTCELLHVGFVSGKLCYLKCKDAQRHRTI